MSGEIANAPAEVKNDLLEQESHLDQIADIVTDIGQMAVAMSPEVLR